MAVAASPLSKEQTVPYRRRKTSSLTRSDLTVLLDSYAKTDGEARKQSAVI